MMLWELLTGARVKDEVGSATAWPLWQLHREGGGLPDLGKKSAQRLLEAGV
jgi:hypothetical protein